MPSTSSEDLSPELASALIDRLTSAQEARRRQRVFYRLFPDEDHGGVHRAAGEHRLGGVAVEVAAAAAVDRGP